MRGPAGARNVRATSCGPRPRVPILVSPAGFDYVAPAPPESPEGAALNPTIARTLYFAAQAWRREPVAEVMRELEASQRWPRERLLALQWERAVALWQRASATVPFYRDAAFALGLTPGAAIAREAWENLPVLDKGTIQRRAADLVAARPGRALRSATSGSSGTPVAVLRSQRSWAHHHANIFRQWHWFGLEVGDPYAYLWGLALDSEGRRQAGQKDLFFNRRRCSAFTLDAVRAREFFTQLNRDPVRFLYGYPSAITLFADEVARAGLDGRGLGLQAAITTAEVLKDEQRHRIEATFGCPVADSYGCAEVGVVGIECERGGLHQAVESVMVETRPADDGRVELLLTDLHNFAQPVIRYRIGDLMEPRGEACACGRGLPLLGRVFGRAGDTLTLPDGRRVNANLPSYVFKHHGKAGTVREYQFVQFPDGRVELRVLPGPAWTEAVAPALRAEVRDALGLDVVLRTVERFDRRGRGKHRDFVRAEDLGEA